MHVFRLLTQSRSYPFGPAGFGWLWLALFWDFSGSFRDTKKRLYHSPVDHICSLRSFLKTSDVCPGLKSHSEQQWHSSSVGIVEHCPHLHRVLAVSAVLLLLAVRCRSAVLSCRPFKQLLICVIWLKTLRHIQTRCPQPQNLTNIQPLEKLVHL